MIQYKISDMFSKPDRQTALSTIWNKNRKLTSFSLLQFYGKSLEALPGVAYPGFRDNRSTLNTKTG